MVLLALVVVALVAVTVLVVRRLLAARGDGIDPFALGEPWRHHVARAQRASRRYQEAVDDVADGPLRDRLEAVGVRLDHAVQECWRVASRAHEVERALRRAEVPGAREEVALARVRLAQLDARFDDAANLAVALALGSGVDDTEQLGAAVDGVVEELVVLRVALEETGGG